MNSHKGIAELLVHYTEGPGRLDEEVVRALERSFGTIISRLPGSDRPPSLEQIPSDPEDVADRLAQIILTFSRAAAAGGPNAKAVGGIRTRLLEFVQRGVPVEVQMLWSPKKHWKLGSESAVDLAELAAFQTLVSIDAAVRTVYRTGVSFVIDFEDIEFQFMEGRSDEIVNAQEIYMSGMKRLLSTLGLDELFALRRMSERAKTEEELSRWRQQMNENYRALEAYWYESEGCQVMSWETLASFKEIRRLGWKGTIPSEMRSYYLNRLGKLTDASDPEKVDMVLRNFAGILLHHQVGLLCGSSGVCPLKFSFVRSADGAPAELLHGRVDLRFAPRKLCSRVSAAGPWATKGFVCGRGSDMRVSFRGWHELAGARCRFAEGWFTIAGPNGNARVRADFMREDKG
jgi:hypothetical protein